MSTYEDEKQALARLETGHMKRSLQEGRARVWNWFSMSSVMTFLFTAAVVLDFKGFTNDALVTIGTLGIPIALAMGVLLGIVAFVYHTIQAGVGAARDASVIRERRKILDRSEVAGGLQIAQDHKGGELELSEEKGAISQVHREER